jgi:hypothetical protein
MLSFRRAGGGNGWYSMYIGPQFEKFVAFVGYADATAPGELRCIGTGFFVIWEKIGYFVTAAHVARVLGTDPFLFRINNKTGHSVLIHGDETEWFYHEDETVDVAVTRVSVGPGNPGKWNLDHLYIPADMLLSDAKMEDLSIGVGDDCYTVGLFRFISGHHRNRPFVFSGVLSLLDAPDETVPVLDDRTNKVVNVRAHLVECIGIKGASGSPVFVTHSADVDDLITRDDGTKVPAKIPLSEAYLLGLFQAAWFLPPDEVVRRDFGATTRDTVPVGLGIVVPAQNIIDLLESAPVKAHREAFRAKLTAARMTADDVPTKATAAEPADANPTHKEDFTSLLTAAVKGKP